MHKPKYTPSSFLTSQDLISPSTTYMKTCVRMLIRAYYHKNSIFGSEILTNSIKIDRIFIHNELKSLGIQISLNYISKQKSLKFMEKAVPRVDLTMDLVSRIKVRYNKFDEKLFFKE